MSPDKGFLTPDDFFASALAGLDEDARSSFSKLVTDHYREQIGDPGEFPFTRGVYSTMYRGRKPTIRQFAGHGLATDTNERFKTVLRLGGTGLSTAFDLPTLMGRDSDDPISEGQVGWDGAAVDTLADMEDLFDGIPIEDITVSMTINGPAAIVLAMYFAMAQKRGIPLEQLGGTTQNDILKEYIAQKEWLFPIEKGVDLVVDTMEFCAHQVPKWHPVSISGYHIREAGATAVQELAYTLADGAWYVRKAIERGMDVHEFAPRLSFFFDVHNDFFEEIAKLRAARRLWARIMRDEFGVTDARSQWCRIHAQTAGVTLTRKEPLNNIARVGLQALAAMLGGVQSLHTNSYDEVFSTPTENALKLALRTQQILQDESEITQWVDPLGGSWLIEELTDRLERQARQEIEAIDRLGGMEAAIELYYPQRSIHASAVRDQRAVESGDRKIVGVNVHQDSDDEGVDVAGLMDELKTRRGFEQRQIERLRRIKGQRSAVEVESALADLRRAAESGEKMMPSLIRAVSTYATVGEASRALQAVWGEYHELDVTSPGLSPQELLDVTQGKRFSRPVRFLLAKGGLDGHTRGIWILADLLRSMGAEVVYAGLHCSMREVAKAAVEEDVDAVGLSSHIGSPTVFYSRLKEELRHYGRDDILITGGGIMLPEDQRFLEEELGVGPVFPPDTPLQEVVERLGAELSARRKSQPVAGPVDGISSTERGRLARLITRLQDDPEAADEMLANEEATQESTAHSVGISGVSGAGKSTLISRMLPVLRGDDIRVVVLAIDPTSERSHGALLGDRIRMRDSYRDEGVFIRSLATRGAPEALTVALPAIIRACSSSCDLVIVETAGAGQVDVGIHRYVDTFVAVVAPLGDAITLMKSGQTEHAHVVAVNVRRGLEGSDRFVEQARVILGRGLFHEGWKRKVFALDAKHDEGIEPFVREGILAHRAAIDTH